jgi:hypothetical protein
VKLSIDRSALSSSLIRVNPASLKQARTFRFNRSLDGKKPIRFSFKCIACPQIVRTASG